MFCISRIWLYVSELTWFATLNIRLNCRKNIFCWSAYSSLTQGSAVFQWSAWHHYVCILYCQVERPPVQADSPKKPDTQLPSDPEKTASSNSLSATNSDTEEAGQGRHLIQQIQTNTVFFFWRCMTFLSVRVLSFERLETCIVMNKGASLCISDKRW